MRVTPAIGLLALLAACGTRPASAPVIAPPKEVHDPVPVACSVTVARPDFPDTVKAIHEVANIAARAQLYAAGRLMRIAYEAKLEAAVTGCSSASAPK